MFSLRSYSSWGRVAIGKGKIKNKVVEKYLEVTPINDNNIRKTN